MAGSPPGQGAAVAEPAFAVASPPRAGAGDPLPGAALLDELAAATRRLDARQLAWLEMIGVGKVARIRGGGVGVARIRAYDDGTYEPDPDDGAVNALVVGAWTGVFWSAAAPWPSPAGAPALVDLVAWAPRDPGRWWTRMGTARFLGDAVDGRLDPRRPVRLCATPLSWLRAVGGDPFGACPTLILEPVPGLGGVRRRRGGDDAGAVYLREMLDGVPEVICDDDDHAAEVYKALRIRPPVATPAVGVAL